MLSFFIPAIWKVKLNCITVVKEPWGLRGLELRGWRSGAGASLYMLVKVQLTMSRQTRAHKNELLD